MIFVIYCYLDIYFIISNTEVKTIIAENIAFITLLFINIKLLKYNTYLYHIRLLLLTFEYTLP